MRVRAPEDETGRPGTKNKKFRRGAENMGSGLGPVMVERKVLRRPKRKSGRLAADERFAKIWPRNRLYNGPYLTGTGPMLTESEGKVVKGYVQGAASE